MKVCTDACIQGAWSSRFLPPGISNLLDIGTGSGLLSLLLAQNTSAPITAIDVEEQAVRQAGENFSRSPWAEQLTVQQKALQDFDPGHLFGFIICNPPFFESDLRSPDDKRNLAMHSSGLSLAELVFHLNRLLDEEGTASVMVPFHRLEELEKLAAGKFFISKKLLVRQTPDHPFFRSVVLLSKQQQGATASETLVIREGGNYTADFCALMKTYYLAM